MRNPFRPISSISFPAELPGGFLKTQPALRSASGWLERRLKLQNVNPVDDLAEGALDQLEPRAEQDVAGRERGAAVFKAHLARAQRIDPAAHRAIDDDFANQLADFGVVGAGVHPQRAAHRARHADQPLESAQIRLGAGGDGAAQLFGRVDPERCAPRSAPSARSWPAAAPPRAARHRPPAGSSRRRAGDGECLARGAGAADRADGAVRARSADRSSRRCRARSSSPGARRAGARRRVRAGRREVWDQ